MLTNSPHARACVLKHYYSTCVLLADPIGKTFYSDIIIIDFDPTETELCWFYIFDFFLLF